MAGIDLDSVANVLLAFYRLVGSESADIALTERGEGDDDVAYLYLTRGSRAAQRFMLKTGYTDWLTRSSALTWTGSDATTGGVYSTLPTDCLRAYGDEDPRRRALINADGSGWGRQIRPDEASYNEGDFFYFDSGKLWLARLAAPPSPLYLRYHKMHAAWHSAVTIDFPLEARSLIVASGAVEAMQEDWLPGGQAMEQRIERALARAKENARDVARQTKQPRTLRKPTRWGNHW